MQISRTIVLGSGVLAMLLAACSTSPDKEAIRAVADDFFHAMETRDTDLASSIVIPSGSFVSVRPGENGREIRSFTNQEWLEGLADRQSEIAERFTDSPFIILEKDVAVLFAEYEFDVNGQPSHTGLDIFNFVRTDDGWRLAGGVYSVEPSD